VDYHFTLGSKEGVILLGNNKEDGGYTLLLKPIMKILPSL
jgi:hypothetical protein